MVHGGRYGGMASTTTIKQDRRLNEMTTTGSGRVLAWVESDGGREAAGFRGKVADCVVRTGSHLLARVTGRPLGVTYREAYDGLGDIQKAYLLSRPSGHWYHRLSPSQQARARSVRSGVMSFVFERWLDVRGIDYREWPGGYFNSGNVLLRDGVYGVLVPGHMFAVIDNRIYDDWDPRGQFTDYKIKGTWELR